MKPSPGSPGDFFALRENARQSREGAEAAERTGEQRRRAWVLWRTWVLQERVWALRQCRDAAGARKKKASQVG
jgi:hypothetical protein